MVYDFAASVPSMKEAKTILVVEDEGDLRELIGFNLERENKGDRAKKLAKGGRVHEMSS